MNNKALENAICDAVGQASTCWSNLNGAGVFQSEQALEIANRLYTFVLSQQTTKTKKIKKIKCVEFRKLDI